MTADELGLFFAEAQMQMISRGITNRVEFRARLRAYEDSFYLPADSRLHGVPVLKTMSEIITSSLSYRHERLGLRDRPSIVTWMVSINKLMASGTDPITFDLADEADLIRLSGERHV